MQNDNYWVEAYISEIRFSKGKDFCEVKLKPTEDFAIKDTNTKRELIAFISENQDAILKASDFFFKLPMGNAGIVSPDFVLSLKQQHVKILFEVNVNSEYAKNNFDEEIISLTIK